MTDKKFTDEEIVKALECCAKSKTNGDCAALNCPCFKYEMCIFVDDDLGLQNCALDLINRQKAELADNERLNKKVDELSEVLSDTIKIRYKEAKTEAYKEFAERLRETSELFYCIEMGKSRYAVAVETSEIDNLLKEMIGE